MDRSAATMMSRRRGLRGIAAVALSAGVLASCGQAAAHTQSAPSVPAARDLWPASICTATTGDQIPTTTAANGDTLRVEPATGTPRTTAAAAYAAYRRHVPAGPTHAQTPALQVRYGLVTGGGEATPGGDAGAIPVLRRYPAWLVSVCNSPTGFGNGGPRLPAHGTMIAIVDNISSGRLIGGSYSLGGSSIGLNSTLVISPPLPSTRYYGTAWTVTARRDHGSRVLLRYTTRPCTTLDHVDTDTQTSTHRILAVVLSGPVHGHACPKPSSGRPYVAATLPNRMPLTAGRTGPLRYQPSSGG